LARRRHRRRHGVDHRRGDRGAPDRARRADRPRLFPDLWHRAHLHHHGGGARLPAARNHGARRVSTVEGRLGIQATGAAAAAPALRLDPLTVAAAAGLIIYPLVATPFFTFQVGGYSLILGTIALSLTVLAGYGGMVSLAQMSVAGVAGYMVAV